MLIQSCTAIKNAVVIILFTLAGSVAEIFLSYFRKHCHKLLNCETTFCLQCRPPWMILWAIAINKISLWEGESFCCNVMHCVHEFPVYYSPGDNICFLKWLQPQTSTFRLYVKVPPNWQFLKSYCHHVFMLITVTFFLRACFYYALISFYLLSWLFIVFK